MSLLIRRALPTDRAAISSLATAFTTSFQVEERAFSTTFKKLLNDPNSYLIVAEIEGKVVGYLLAFAHSAFYANGEVTWIEEIMVEADVRKQGIGQALMQNAEDWARERGCKVVALATRRAAAFYLAIGYEDSAKYFRKLL